MDSLNRQVNVKIKVFIVDHGTIDFKLQKNYDYEVVILKRSSKLWFTGAINEGLKEVIKDNLIKYVCLMNDDIIIEKNDLLFNLKSKIIDNNAIVSAMAITKDKNIIYSGLKLNLLTTKFIKLNNNKKYISNSLEFIECDVLPTRCIMFSKELLIKHGIFNDKDLPHYGSDYEWTMRLKKYGYKLLMSQNDYIIIDDDINSRVSGRKKYKKNKFFAFITDLFDKKQYGSIYVNFFTIYKNYNFFYVLYFVSNRFFRRILGFFYTNYIKRI